MIITPKAPPVYKPTSQRIAAPSVYRPGQNNAPGVQLRPARDFKLETRPAPLVCQNREQGTGNRGQEKPPVYRPNQGNAPSAQLKPADNFRLETRPAPPVYRPEQMGASTNQQKPNAVSVQRQSQISNQALVGIYQKLGFRNAGVIPGGNPKMPAPAVMPVQRFQRVFGFATSLGSHTVQLAQAVEAPAGPTVEYTDHWNNYHHEDAQTIVEANADDIASDIWNGIAEDTADDTKVVVNYDRAGNHYQRYLVVVTYYRDDGRVRFHSARKSHNRGTAYAQTDIILDLNWNWA